MARILVNPTVAECPDYASATYAVTRAPLINANTTEDEAVQLLKNIWKAGNDADKAAWEQQVNDDATDVADQIRLAEEAEVQRLDTLRQEEELSHKEELKKNKEKYLLIPDRDAPTIAPILPATYAVRKMKKGLYTEMHYYTNKGLDEALSGSSTIDDEAMILLQNPNGTTSWVPAASARDSRGVTEDKDLTWEDFCQAAPRMIRAMEEASWPEDRVAMLAKFWGNLQIHELRSSRDPLDQKTLLVYQAEQRKAWHLAIPSPQGAWNISRINDEIMRKVKERVYWEARNLKDNERDFRVRTVSTKLHSHLKY
ncbi:hypothetical protein SCP_0201280 [Sparassis crispa]|uniref:Uncharacterized protein n=1 Tax=Sparassis crispa TaxID=139825 RepID=A0A401G9V0_9APHY|nr:hypothetical protein SCP_0201280 [Sparassis crispa]GBE78931.1 hypothetical protein SCP_0201280 [Sparassis crispa]